MFLPVLLQLSYNKFEIFAIWISWKYSYKSIKSLRSYFWNEVPRKWSFLVVPEFFFGKFWCINSNILFTYKIVVINYLTNIMMFPTSSWLKIFQQAVVIYIPALRLCDQSAMRLIKDVTKTLGILSVCVILYSIF